MTDKNVCPTGEKGIGDWRFDKAGPSTAVGMTDRNVCPTGRGRQGTRPCPTQAKARMRASPNAGEPVPRRRGSQGLPSTSSGSPRCYDGRTRGKKEIGDLKRGAASNEHRATGEAGSPTAVGMTDRNVCPTGRGRQGARA